MGVLIESTTSTITASSTTVNHAASLSVKATATNNLKSHDPRQRANALETLEALGDMEVVRSLLRLWEQSDAAPVAQAAALKTQARQAVRYRNISGQVRRTEALLHHLRWTAAGIEVTDAERAQDEAVRVVAARVSEQTQASTRQADLAAGLPALREGEARAAAALQRLIVARETLEREEARAKERIAELDRRLEQFAGDLEREQTLAADAA